LGLVASVTEVEVDSRGIAEIVLKAIVEWVIKVGEQVIDFARSEGHHLTDRDIYTTAKFKRKRIVGGRFRKRTSSDNGLTDGFESIPVNVGMGAPEQDVSERLNFGRAEFDLWTEQIGKQIALNIAGKSTGKIAHTGRNDEMSVIAAVALKVRLDAQILVDVVDEGTAAAIQAVTLGIGTAGSVASVAVIAAHFS